MLTHLYQQYGPVHSELLAIVLALAMHHYRLGTVISKSFIGKVFLQIKWKFELNYGL